MIIILSLQSEISNTIYSNVYSKVKQVCRDHFMSLPCYPLYLWKVYSVILQLWKSSSTISSRTNCHLAFECAPLNWFKKHNNASRKTYSFFEVKLRQFLKKTWTKINKIFVFKKQHTVNILCLQFKWNIRSLRHNIRPSEKNTFLVPAPPASFFSAVSLFFYFIWATFVWAKTNRRHL